MDPAIPAHTDIKVRVPGTELTVPAFATPPVLSAARLSIRGFVFEQRRFCRTDLVSGPLLNPVVLFALQDGIAVEWNRGDRQDKEVTQTGAFATFPSGTGLDGCWRGELDTLVFSFETEECRSRIPGLRLNGSSGLNAVTNVQDAQLWHLALALQAEAEAGCPAGRQYAEAVALAMSVSLFSRYCGRAQVDPFVPASIQAVVQYIRDNIHEDLRLDSVAVVAQMTPPTFRRLFTASMGLPPHQFILQERIHRSKQLLLDRSLTIAQVAYAVGFSNQAHFDTVFRRFESITPKFYRQRFFSSR